MVVGDGAPARAPLLGRRCRTAGTGTAALRTGPHAPLRIARQPEFCVWPTSTTTSARWFARDAALVRVVERPGPGRRPVRGSPPPATRSRGAARLRTGAGTSPAPCPAPGACASRGPDRWPRAGELVVDPVTGSLRRMERTPSSRSRSTPPLARRCTALRSTRAATWHPSSGASGQASSCGQGGDHGEARLHQPATRGEHPGVPGGVPGSTSSTARARVVAATRASRVASGSSPSR